MNLTRKNQLRMQKYQVLLRQELGFMIKFETVDLSLNKERPE